MKSSGGFELFVRYGGLAVAELGFKELKSLPHGFRWFVPGCASDDFRKGFTRRTLCLFQDFIGVLRKGNGLNARTQGHTQIEDRIKSEDRV
jgi:hypothetical protein